MDDLDPEARRLLGLVREARTPTDRDKARMDGLLASSVVLGTASTAHAATSTAAKSAGTAIGLKWAAGVAVLSVVGAAGYLGFRASQASVERPPDATTMVVTDRPVAPPEPAAAEPAVVSVPEATVEESPHLRHAGKAAAEAASGGIVTLPEELDLLHEVQAKWRKGDASAALTLLAEHRKRYPKSQLGSERDALTVLSLCAVGRTDEARKIARRFLSAAPRSPLRASVEESCGGR
jgi:hypothetical protein